MLILHDPATISHSTIELLGSKLIPALESPSRITAMLHSLQGSSAHTIRTTTASDAMIIALISRTHDDGYISHLRTAHSSWVAAGNIACNESVLPECFPFPTTTRNGRPPHRPPKDLFARAGYYAFDMSTGISASTWTSALASANLAIEGVRALLPHSPPPPAEVEAEPPATTVLALCRPPGHHCDTKRAGGYCYINNAVVAVEAYRRLHQTPIALETSMNPAVPPQPPRPKIAILDLDFHHGNGTQESFYSDPDVLYVSIHGEDEYPYYTGSASETGVGPGQGMNVNLPLKARSGFEAYREKLGEGLRKITAQRPEFVVISLGFDTYSTDPLGSFKIETEDYEEMAATVARSVSELLLQRGCSEKEIPVLILLEGGYVIEKLGENMLSFLKGWEKTRK